MLSLQQVEGEEATISVAAAMRRPSFQFYPADWRNNANLRRCSWAARGAWIEIMGLLHDSDHYGVLHWTLKEIAQAIGCPVALVKELGSKDVLKGVDSGLCDSLIYVPRSGRKDGQPVELIAPQAGPIWYSSRMVKDEYIREVRGENSRFDGDNNQSPKPTPKPPLGESPKPTPKPFKSDGSTSTSTSTLKATLGEVVDSPPAAASIPAENPTRKGDLCKRLRLLGIDAAPHLQAWPGLLAGYSDEQILSVAEKARESKPGERIHLNYLVPMLADTKAPQARGSPPNGKQALRADYLRQQGYTGGENGDSGGERIIDGQAERVA